MGELGLFGLPFSEEYGGAGADFLSLCLAIEEISRGDAGVGITPRRRCVWALHPFTTSERRAKTEAGLPDHLRGQEAVAFGLTEPEQVPTRGLQDAGRVRDGHWVVNGAKQFITNCGTGDLRRRDRDPP